MIPLDIETRPRPDLVMRFVKPPEPFDAGAVKHGNTKDPEKRAALFQQKQLDHENQVSDYWANAKDRASLNPLTAEIVCIGFLIPVCGKNEKPQIEILSGDETDILRRFWAKFSDFGLAGDRFAYWSGNGNPTDNFDPDMIIRRSWLLGVRVPPTAFNGRFLSNRFEDAAGRYLLYKRETFCGLSRAGDELGLFVAGAPIFPKSELDRVQGVNFHLYWDGKADPAMTPEAQRALALKYLTNDLLILNGIIDRVY